MTDFLFTKPSWLDGAMSLVDLFAVALEFNTSASAIEADKKALKADVKVLQQDMQNAYNLVKTAYVK